MKKSIVALTLVLALLCASLPAAAVFTDVTDPAEKNACELLAALNIVSGKGGGRYDPRGYMTRAEFCKVALKLAGFSSESLYGSYTLFSDVAHTRWYAPYVNAAVKQYKIIEGYGDGTFRPDANIKYSEASTILLRLLGYERADIGDFWPADYMAKAAALELTKGVSATLSVGAAIPRGQAAILLVNTLLTAKKDGSQLLSGAFTMDSTRSLLLATPATDSTLSAGTARICTADGAVKVVATAASFSADGVMKRGLCVWQKDSLIYFRAESAGTAVIVRSRTNTTITTEQGTTIAVPSAALLCDGSKTGTYSDEWLSLPVGQTATLFYGSQGTLELIVTGGTSNIGTSTAIYGVDSVVFSSGAAILRDGERVAAAAVQKYDAVSYDSAANTYYVSSDRLTLRYSDAGAVYTSPTWVRLGSLKLVVAPDAAADFAALRFGDLVTVSLDVNGRVAGAWKSSEVSVKAVAILNELSESACKATTLTGHALEGAPSFEGFTKTSDTAPSTLYAQLGRLVTVTQDAKGNYLFAPVAYANAGTLSLSTSRLGTAPLAARVRVYEQLGSGLPLSLSSLDALRATGLTEVKVLHSTLNSSGAADLLVVESVTGSGYTYGMAKQTSKVEETVYDGFNGDTFTVTQIVYTLTLTDSSGSTEIKQTAAASGIGATAAPAAWYKVGDTYMAAALSSAGTVTADAFVTAKRVRVGVNTLAVMDGVQVWDPARSKSIGLSEAVLNYQSFALYTTRPAADGGMVCFIVAVK